MRSKFLNQVINVAIECIEARCIPKNGSLLQFCVMIMSVVNVYMHFEGIFAKSSDRHFEDDGHESISYQ